MTLHQNDVISAAGRVYSCRVRSPAARWLRHSDVIGSAGGAVLAATGDSTSWQFGDGAAAQQHPCRGLNSYDVPDYIFIRAIQSEAGNVQVHVSEIVPVRSEQYNYSIIL